MVSAIGFRLPLSWARLRLLRFLMIKAGLVLMFLVLAIRTGTRTGTEITSPGSRMLLQFPFF